MDRYQSALRNIRVEAEIEKSAARIMMASSQISQLLKGGTVHRVEGLDDKICQMIDRVCGVDWFQVYEDKKLVQGIATRTQVIKDGYKPYNSFTTRKEIASGNLTEYHKRKYAIDHGGVYPYLQLQLYVDECDEPISLAIAKTVDIIDFIDNGYAFVKHTGVNQRDPAEFYVCRWDSMILKGYHVEIWQKEE